MAVVVDYGLAALIVLACVYPFTNPNGGGLRLSGTPFSSFDCAPLDVLPDRITAALEGATIVGAQRCDTRQMFIPNGAHIDVAYQPEGAPAPRLLSVAIDEEGEPVRVTTVPQGFFALALMFAVTILLHQRGRATPGKAQAGLHLTGDGAIIRREVWRLGPFLAIACIDFLFVVAGRTAASQSVAYLAGIVLTALLLATLFYVLIPLIRWRGSMPWDWRSGFRVERSP